MHSSSHLTNVILSLSIVADYEESDDAMSVVDGRYVLEFVGFSDDSFSYCASLDDVGEAGASCYNFHSKSSFSYCASLHDIGEAGASCYNFHSKSSFSYCASLDDVGLYIT